MTTRSAQSSALLALLQDRPIAYHPALAKPLGGVCCALFVSQMLYWDGRGKKQGRWIYKTQEEWTEETGLTRSNLDTSRIKLKKRGILEEKLEGVPATLNYRLNFDRLAEVIEEAYSLRDSCKLDCDDPANKTAETTQTIPETTTETTSEKIPGAIAPPEDRAIQEATGLMFHLDPGNRGLITQGEGILFMDPVDYSLIEPPTKDLYPDPVAPPGEVFKTAIEDETDIYVTCPYQECAFDILLTDLNKSAAVCPKCGANLRIRDEEGKVIYRPRQKARRTEKGSTVNPFFWEAVNAFMNLAKVNDIPTKTRAQWAHTLQGIATVCEVDADQMIAAMGAIKDSDHKWKTFASPYERTFSDVMLIMTAQLKGGKPDPHEDAFAKLRDRPVNL